jgi:hypothetical protein
VRMIEVLDLLTLHYTPVHYTTLHLPYIALQVTRRISRRLSCAVPVLIGVPYPCSLWTAHHFSSRGTT